MTPAPTFHGRRRTQRGRLALSPQARKRAVAGILLFVVLAAVLAWLMLPIPAPEPPAQAELPVSQPLAPAVQTVAPGTEGAPAEMEDRGSAPVVGEPAPPPAAAVAAAPAPASVDIFPVRTWEPPAPPVTEVAAAPEPPPVPPLPFVFLGRIAEPGKATAFMLNEGGKVRVVRVGDRVGGSYQLERYQDGNLMFFYQPMNVRQTLEIGERS